MKKITKPGFLHLTVPLPLAHEQKKMAKILSTWDNAIEQTRKLIEAKKRLKKALMQQLLTGEIQVKVNDKFDHAEGNS